MHFMVNALITSISSELISQLYQEDKFEHLLQESEFITMKRQRASQMLNALNDAHKILSNLRDLPSL